MAPGLSESSRVTNVASSQSATERIRQLSWRCSRCYRGVSLACDAVEDTLECQRGRREGAFVR